MTVLPLKKRYSAILSDDLPASSNNMHLILSQEARIALKAGALAPVLLSSCLVKNLLSHHWSHVYQQLDSLFLQLEFFLSSTAQLGYAKIALAQQFSFIFFKNE